MPHPRHALAELAERFWQFQRREFPLTAFLAGEGNDDPTMFREAPYDFDRRARAAGEMRATLDAISADGLDAQQRATHRLLARELDDLRDAYAVHSHLRPWLLPVGPEFNSIYFANTSHVGDAASAELYVERLASVPRLFADIEACLREGLAFGIRYPRRVLERAAAYQRAVVSGPAESLPWYGPFVRSPAASNPAVQAQAARALALIGERIVPGLRRLADFIERELKPRSRESIACIDDPHGREFYDFWARHFTTVSTPPEEIHALGLEEVSRLEGEIEAVAADAGYAGDVAGYREFLSRDPQFFAPSAEVLRERMQIVSKRIDRCLPTFFGRLPRVTYGIESIPEALSERMPAYAQPGPADRSAAGIYWVSSLPSKCPSYQHLPLALHEGWPGHLMHIALMQEMDELPAFRRHNATKYSACLEGWALYCERLGVDMQLYKTPHEHFGRLDMEMWRACRLVADTGLHLKGWSAEQAIDYLDQRISLPRKAIEAEVDRYIAMPAQALGYQIGNLKFRALRDRAEQRLGDRFDLRAFHDNLMSAGPVTLPVLDELVDDWLERRVA